MIIKILTSQLMLTIGKICKFLAISFWVILMVGLIIAGINCALHTHYPTMLIMKNCACNSEINHATL